MRSFEDPRWAGRLDLAERAAAPFLPSLGLADDRDVPHASFASPPRPLDPAALDALRSVPLDALTDLRLVLLRRIAESEHGTADSPQGLLRAQLSGPASLAADDIALELGLCRFAMDLGFGVGLAWRRLGLLDATLAELERTPLDGVSRTLVDEVEGSIALLASDMMIMDAGATDRRFRLLLFLQRVIGGSLPAHAFDPGDPFGEAMRAIVASDKALAEALAPLLPVAARATSVLPGREQRTSLVVLVPESDAATLPDAIDRVVARLLHAPLKPRGPGFVTVRPSNQRLGRAVLWALPGQLPHQAAVLLGDAGVRLGTSGKRDNQARDAALAGTCAALLGQMESEDAIASLARMYARIRNKVVRRQIEKALAAAAERAGCAVDELVERSLPTFGLDAAGRRIVWLDGWTATVRLDDDGRVIVAWRGADGESSHQAPSELRERSPGEVAEVAQLVEEIRAAIADERRRLERLLSEERAWSLDAWRRRFLEHPVAGVHGRRLIWRFSLGDRNQDGMPDGDGLIDATGRPLDGPPPDALVRLWHPVESSPAEVDAWRDRVVERGLAQPFKQAFREMYQPSSEPDSVLDRRFADRPLAYGRLRALVGARGWSAPMLGPFDQGDRAVASLEVAGLRAELEHAPAGMGAPDERVEFARSGSVRFTAMTGDERSPVLLGEVPPRLLSEVLRDVDLFTSVADSMRTPASSLEMADTASLRMRAEAMRRLVSRLPDARYLSVIGLWLRVERDGRAWAISLATGMTLRLPVEEEVEVTVDDDVAIGYVPFEDEMMVRVLRTARGLLDLA